MKSGLLILLSIIYTLSLHAQNNFEGRITYKMEPGKDSLRNSSVEVFLKGNLMLFKGNNKEQSKPMHYLFDFNKGIFYNFLLEDSVALKNVLFSSPFFKKENQEKEILNILGYETKKTDYYIISPPDKSFKSIEAWYSKKILFKIADSVRSIQPPFIFFNDGSISLKVKVILNNQSLGYDVPETLTITASSIIRENLSDSIFEIPKFLKEMSQKDYIEELLEKFKTIDAGLQKNNSNTKIEVIGKPEMTQIKTDQVPPPPPPPAVPKKKIKH